MRLCRTYNGCRPFVGRLSVPAWSTPRFVSRPEARTALRLLAGSPNLPPVGRFGRYSEVHGDDAI